MTIEWKRPQDYEQTQQVMSLAVSTLEELRERLAQAHARAEKYEALYEQERALRESYESRLGYYR